MIHGQKNTKNTSGCITNQQRKNEKSSVEKQALAICFVLINP